MARIHWPTQIRRGAVFAVLFAAMAVVTWFSIERFALHCQRAGEGFACTLERTRWFSTERHGFTHRTLLGAEVRRVVRRDPQDNSETVDDYLSLLTDKGVVETAQDRHPRELADRINAFVRAGAGVRLDIIESDVFTRLLWLGLLGVAAGWLVIVTVRA
jgi:hypothetical protein